MHFDITGHHIEVTDALREYVESRASKIEQHFDCVSDVHFTLTVDKAGHKAEATASMKGKRLHAEATQENMYAAIDNLYDKLNRRVRKYKERIKQH
jgi:putative sigma-54 modulation protein